MTATAHKKSWPLLRLVLPPDAGDEQIGLMSQAAADHGALGTQLEDEHLVIFLAREIKPAARAALLDSLAAEAHALGWEFISPQLEALDDAPWATAWKDRFFSFAVGERLLIRPDWELGKPAAPQFAGRSAIYLRPGLGFGTGHHETTRLALLFLEKRLNTGDAVLDVGSGSGVLSIAAVRLGAGRVTALEFDPEANENAVENFAINGLDDQIELIESNTAMNVRCFFNLIICNMIPQQSLSMIGELLPLLADADSKLILTGFLADQRDEVEASLEAAGLRRRESAFEGAWGGMAARRG